MSRARRSARRSPSRRPQRRKTQRRQSGSAGLIFFAGALCLLCFLCSYVGNTLWAGMTRESLGDDLAYLNKFSREVRSDLTRQVSRNAQFVVLGQRMEETVDKGDEVSPENVLNQEALPEEDVVAEVSDVTED